MSSDCAPAVYWLGHTQEQSSAAFGATVLRSRRELEETELFEPAIFLLDLRREGELSDPKQIRTILGPVHVIVALVTQTCETALASLYRSGIDDVVDAGHAEPAPVLARAAAQLRLRTLAERERRRVELLQAALDNLPTPVFIKDAAGVYRGCNGAFERFIGFQRDFIVGHTVYDIAPPALAAVYQEADNELLARGGTQTYEARVRYADGTEHDVIFHKAVFHDAKGEPRGLAGAMLDITARKRLEVELRELAEQDPLTGLANRRKFFALAEHMRASQQSAPTTNWVLAIDVDHFKSINDSFGHAMGDRVLQRIAHTLRDTVRVQDAIARTGGEEFLAILVDVDREACAGIAERLRQAVEDAMRAAPEGLPPATISVGGGRWRMETESVEAALKRADEQMYLAKRAGRNRVSVDGGL
jgi:diguanylate cyclase (GGDEF)-like protein/PAS domain S-box-containing protein